VYSVISYRIIKGIYCGIGHFKKQITPGMEFTTEVDQRRIGRGEMFQGMNESDYVKLPGYLGRFAVVESAETADSVESLQVAVVKIERE